MAPDAAPMTLPDCGVCRYLSPSELQRQRRAGRRGAGSRLRALKRSTRNIGPSVIFWARRPRHGDHAAAPNILRRTRGAGGSRGRGTALDQFFLTSWEMLSRSSAAGSWRA